MRTALMFTPMAASAHQKDMTLSCNCSTLESWRM